MNKMLLRFCAAALSVVFFCSSGVFAMFNVSADLSFPSEPLRYNKILAEKGYPYYIDGISPFIKSQWSKFWWADEAMRRNGIDFKGYVNTSRSYPLVAQITARRRNDENGRSEKWERLIRAFKSAADSIFYLFLEDFYNEFYRRDCIENNRFTSDCLWRILYEVNPLYVERKLGEDVVKKLGEGRGEDDKDTAVTEIDIDRCVYGIERLVVFPCRPHTLDAVQFIAEGLYYMHFDSLVIFFSNLYAYFFQTRIRRAPEEIYIIHSCIESLYCELITSVLEEHKKERPGWFDSYQYEQLLRLSDCCNPESEIFRSRVMDIEPKFLGLKK